MNEVCDCWLKGILRGDGYKDDRHIEIFNSSVSILKNVVTLLKQHTQPSKIKVDIYSDFPSKKLIFKWLNILELPFENYKLRQNTSPWKINSEKIRVRVSSKELTANLSKKPEHIEYYLSGLFDAEASVDIKGYIEFKQVASEEGKKLVYDVFETLKNMRILTTQPRIKNDRNIKTDSYIYVKDIEKFNRNIGFIDISKKTKLEILIKIKQNNETPDLKEILKLVNENKSLWEIIDVLNSPYHRIRYILKRNHLSIRQTR